MGVCTGMDETTTVDVRTTILTEFETGEAIRVHYRDADDEPHKCLTGRVVTHYGDRKALLETDDDRRLVVDLADVTTENIRDFDTDEYLGRGMFAETAYHPEKDGQDLREELLGDDDETDDTDDDDLETDGGQDDAEVQEAARVRAEILQRDDVPEGMKDDVRDMDPAEVPRDLLGLATNLGIAVDVTDDDVAAPVTETLDVEEGDEIELDYTIAIGDHAGDENTHRGTVTNVSKAGSLIQYRTPGAKGTTTVSLRSGAIHVQNTFKDIHVGRDATVTVLEGDE